MLPDEDHQPPRGADRQQVQQDGLERQDQRAERPRQQQEGQHADQGDDEREVAVDRVEEVGALRGLAAGHDVGRQVIGGRADAVERRAARGRVAVLDRDDRDQRRCRRGASRRGRPRSRTPSTPARACATACRIAGADQRVERRERPGADARSRELIEPCARRARLGQRVGARVAELDRGGRDDERAQGDGRCDGRDPAVAHDDAGPGRPAAARRDRCGRVCAADRASDRSWPARPAAASRRPRR